jgi:nitronate monooxygenase
VIDRFALTDMSIRIVGAPMAGGPSTPALAAAVANCGGLSSQQEESPQPPMSGECVARAQRRRRSARR